MAQHAELRIDTGLAIYFCDPHSPWQRGTNENTNGLLRQWFPKGTDLSKHSADELAAVAAALNTRPHKILGWRTPPETLDELLRSCQHGSVAKTPCEPWGIRWAPRAASGPGRCTRGRGLHLIVADQPQWRTIAGRLAGAGWTAAGGGRLCGACPHHWIDGRVGPDGRPPTRRQRPRRDVARPQRSARR